VSLADCILEVCFSCAESALRLCCGCVVVVSWLCCGCVAVCCGVAVVTKGGVPSRYMCNSPPPLAVPPLLSLSFPLLKSCGSFSSKYVIERDTSGVRTSGVRAHAREKVCARV